MPKKPARYRRGKSDKAKGISAGLPPRPVPRVGPLQAMVPDKAAMATRPSTVPALSRVPRAAGALPTDYHYVISDVKRIGILAGSIVAILLILSFVFR